MEEKKKGCSSCGNKKFPALEFTKKEKAAAIIAVVIVFFTFYGMVSLVKDIISIF
ncbi:MAG: hypothetical protein RLZ10_1515 [Bacteroidota bacterium]|jgi:hypothetical protein